MRSDLAVGFLTIVSRSVLLLLVAAITLGGCRNAAPARAAAPPSVFTPAHRTTWAAFSDFFGVRPTPVQPIAFPHKTHVAKKIACTEYCHEGVTRGPIAGLPSVKTCMICHAAIAADRPLIKTIADYESRGVELPWQRVYGYPQTAHVRFNHAPHIRAGVECANCHGDVAQQTVAERSVNLSMGFCVSCHIAKKAPNECITCHY